MVGQSRRDHRPLSGRQLHHQPGDGRLLGHRRQAHPTADRTLGRARRHPGTALGSLTVPERTRGNAMDVSTFRAWIAEATRLVVENADHLTHLDAAIGDADHGITLSRGFQAAQAMLDETSPAMPGAALTTVGRALISKTGGAAGPLYGTGFRQAGTAVGEAPDVSAVRLGIALAAGLAGIQQLGAAAEGDKTMVDALIPAVNADPAVGRTRGDPPAATPAAAGARA